LLLRWLNYWEALVVHILRRNISLLSRWLETAHTSVAIIGRRRWIVVIVIVIVIRGRWLDWSLSGRRHNVLLILSHGVH